MPHTSEKCQQSEKAKKSEQLALFAIAKFMKTSDVQVVIYEFDTNGLNLSVADAMQRGAGRRLMVQGDPVHVGFWPHVPEEGSPPFDQSGADPFEDVGDLDEGGAESGGDL